MRVVRGETTVDPSGARIVAMKSSFVETSTPQALLNYANRRWGQRVLDIGCGARAPTVELASRVGGEGHVIGLDLSQQVVEHAMRHESSSERGNLNFVLADAQWIDPGTQRGFAPPAPHWHAFGGRGGVAILDRRPSRRLSTPCRQEQAAIR